MALVIVRVMVLVLVLVVLVVGIIIRVEPQVDIIGLLLVTHALATFLSHGSEDPHIRPIVIVPITIVIFDHPIAEFGWVPHTGKHDICQLLLTQTLIGRVEN